MKAQQALVQRFLNWDWVHDRLNKFSNIRQHYEDGVLLSCADRSPYYCHYMAWRLGTWHNENLFFVFDKLLWAVSHLPNWKNEFRSFQTSCRFEEYWSLLWQLQVAYFFSRRASVAWNPSGPDLTVEMENGKFYIECYCYQKSFGIEEFAMELFRHIDPAIHVEHRSYIPFSLPHNDRTDEFLDELFRPYLDPDFLKNKRHEAKHRWPVLLPVPSDAKNFKVYLEGPAEAYDPRVIPNYSGIPEDYLADAIGQSGVGNKKNSNNLRNFRPNVLAINYLLSGDFQTAHDRQQVLKCQPAEIEFGDSLDAVILAACGIDEELSLSQLNVSTKADIHPIVYYLRETDP